MHLQKPGPVPALQGTLQRNFRESGLVPFPYPDGLCSSPCFPVNLPEPLPLQLKSFSGQDRTALLPLTWAVAPSTCSADEKLHPLQPPLHDIRPSPPSSFTHTCCPSSWGLQAPGSLGPHWQQGQGFKEHLLSGAMVTPKPRLLL